MSNYRLTQTGEQFQQDLDFSENLQPPFSTESTYSVGNLVVYNGALYRCKSRISTPGSWDATKWDKCTLGELVDTKQEKIVASGIPSEAFDTVLGFNTNGVLCKGSFPSAGTIQLYKHHITMKVTKGSGSSQKDYYGYYDIVSTVGTVPAYTTPGDTDTLNILASSGNISILVAYIKKNASYVALNYTEEVGFLTIKFDSLTTPTNAEVYFATA